MNMRTNSPQFSATPPMLRPRPPISNGADEPQPLHPILGDLARDANPGDPRFARLFEIRLDDAAPVLGSWPSDDRSGPIWDAAHGFRQVAETVSQQAGDNHRSSAGPREQAARDAAISAKALGTAESAAAKLIDGHGNVQSLIDNANPLPKWDALPHATVSLHLELGRTLMAMSPTDRARAVQLAEVDPANSEFAETLVHLPSALSGARAEQRDAIKAKLFKLHNPKLHGAIVESLDKLDIAIAASKVASVQLSRAGAVVAPTSNLQRVLGLTRPAFK